eukprot:TRINITY_DN101640_c0_g1_i1.p1 TRINITY_DN101640_c0_g1~~TRINITY_DN101640_c0_g1_i1.p1  ORF type:complete len:415 (-),score=68.13 TRINITY_DN101640_c0_g1_i1:410-1654(-)
MTADARRHAGARLLAQEGHAWIPSLAAVDSKRGTVAASFHTPERPRFAAGGRTVMRNPHRQAVPMKIVGCPSTRDRHRPQRPVSVGGEGVVLARVLEGEDPPGWPSAKAAGLASSPPSPRGGGQSPALATARAYAAQAHQSAAGSPRGPIAQLVPSVAASQQPSRSGSPQSAVPRPHSVQAMRGGLYRHKPWPADARDGNPRDKAPPRPHSVAGNYGCSPCGDDPLTSLSGGWRTSSSCADRCQSSMGFCASTPTEAADLPPLMPLDPDEMRALGASSVMSVGFGEDLHFASDWNESRLGAISVCSDRSVTRRLVRHSPMVSLYDVVDETAEAKMESVLCVQKPQPHCCIVLGSRHGDEGIERAIFADEQVPELMHPRTRSLLHELRNVGNFGKASVRGQGGRIAQSARGSRRR